MQKIARDSLRGDCTSGGASWSPTGPEFDSCATTEGFADYLGAASWYDGGVSGTQPLLEGFNYETATAQNAVCSANRGIPLQVTRSFWDFDDVDNEAGVTAAVADADSWPETDIATAWSLFPDGTANRQDQESDAHGVNMRDYRANTNGFFGNSATMTQTILQHNCIDTQDDG